MSDGQILKETDIAVITSCSKSKLTYPAAARDFYQGQFFKTIRKFATQINTDLYLVSAFYGLIPADAMVKPYNLRISTETKAKALQPKVQPKIAILLEKYEKIVVLMGSLYQMSMGDQIFNSQVFRSIDHRGNGGYNEMAWLLSKFTEGSFRAYLSEIDSKSQITCENLRIFLNRNVFPLQSGLKTEVL
jgi:cytoplasmic iron level regulating protein YaaA (DUF328/UPF0246 family)